MTMKHDLDDKVLVMINTGAIVQGTVIARIDGVYTVSYPLGYGLGISTMDADESQIEVWANIGEGL